MRRRPLCDVLYRRGVSTWTAKLKDREKYLCTSPGSCLHFRPPRQGRNPKTGETVALAGKYVPHFKPGKDLRERVNEPEEGDAHSTLGRALAPSASTVE